jgi:hypothetical protein
VLCFCPEVKNEEELIKLLENGKWDKDIFEYLIKTMKERDNKLLEYNPIDFFEMQASLLDENKLLCLSFWNKEDSGIYNNFRYVMNKKQEEFFDMFVVRIQEIYGG